MSASVRKNEPADEPLSKLKSPAAGPPVFRVVRADTDLFATLDGLEMQTGVDRDVLRRLVLKELTDNALDAADTAGRGGHATIRKLGDHQYEITDQGNGIPGTPEDLAGLFSIHRPMVSAKFWRLPSRGALGNGLRVIVGAIIACGGSLEITTRGQCVALRPTRIDTQVINASPAGDTVGTRIVVTFGPNLDEDHDDLSWSEAAIEIAEQAEPAFMRNPSPHWQDADQFSEILGTIEPCRSLLPHEAAVLLAKLQDTARCIKPEALGLLGADTYGGMAYAKQLGSFEYGSRAPRALIPFAVEAWVDVKDRKRQHVGLDVFANRTPIIESITAYRGWNKKRIGISGAGLNNGVEVAMGACTIVINITSPLIPISSIGKRPNLKPFFPMMSEAIRLAFNRSRRLLPQEAGDPDEPEDEKPPKPPTPPSHKSLVLKWLREAIAQTSQNGEYTFGLHNLYYKVNELGRFHELTGKRLTKANFAGIITDYEDEHGDIEGMVRDARGIFMSRSGSFALGTAEAAAYNRPVWEYHKLLYCEKEDILRILDQAGWWQRHDSSMETAKGYSSRAARDIIDDIADTSDREPIAVFGLHDADAPGSMIAQTLQEATRARGRRRIEIIDLGLYPWQAIKMGLPVEKVSYDNPHPVSELVRTSTERHPKTGEVVDWDDWLQHHRIELSALTPAKLIAFLDEAVEQHGTLKVVPPPGIAARELWSTIEGEVQDQERERVLAEAEERISTAVAERLRTIRPLLPTPDDLVIHISETVAKHRRQHWTDVVGDVANGIAKDGGTQE